MEADLLKIIDKLEELIDAKIEYAFASREEGADGYMTSATNERKKVEQLTSEITELKSELKKEDELKQTCNCDPDIIGSYAGCPEHDPNL